MSKRIARASGTRLNGIQRDSHFVLIQSILRSLAAKCGDRASARSSRSSGSSSRPEARFPNEAKLGLDGIAVAVAVDGNRQRDGAVAKLLNPRDVAPTNLRCCT